MRVKTPIDHNVAYLLSRKRLIVQVTYSYIYIYHLSAPSICWIYIYICVCVCVYLFIHSCIHVLCNHLQYLLSDFFIYLCINFKYTYRYIYI